MNDSFFENLAQRVNSENNLSDIVWAACQSYHELKIHFLKFFFKDFDELEKIIEFTREHRKDDSIPDFYIKTNKNEYLIENKIGDKNQHFEQYEKTFPDFQYGFIANYNIAPIQGWNIRTWEEFYNYLNDLIKKETLPEEISQLSLYIQRVCKIIKVSTMDLSRLNSIISLNEIVKRILNENTTFQVNSIGLKCDCLEFNIRYGNYYEIKRDENKSFKPWIGVYFSSDGVVIYVEIRQEWCPEAFKLLQELDKNEAFQNAVYYEKPYYDDMYRYSSYALHLKQEKFDELNKMQSVEEQKELLKKYLDEILLFVNDCF